MNLAVHGLLLALLMTPGMEFRMGIPPKRDAPAILAQAGLMPAEGEGQKEDHEALFKIINFVLLAGGLGYLLRKPLAGFYLDRSVSIRKGLEEGRKALEESQAKLRAVEEKLARLEEELQVFKASALREMEAEHERLRRASAEEAERILEVGRTQAEAAARAALKELKSYATYTAVKLAEELILQRLDAAARSRLVSQFIAGLEPGREA